RPGSQAPSPADPKPSARVTSGTRRCRCEACGGVRNRCRQTGSVVPRDGTSQESASQARSPPTDSVRGVGQIEHDGGAGPHLSRRRGLGVLLGSAVAATVGAAIRDQSRGPSGGGPSSTVPNGGSAASGPASPKPMSVGAQSVPTSAVRAGRPEVIFNGDPAGG